MLSLPSAQIRQNAIWASRKAKVTAIGSSVPYTRASGAHAAFLFRGRPPLRPFSFALWRFAAEVD